jgi:hypothetical protein
MTTHKWTYLKNNKTTNNESIMISNVFKNQRFVSIAIAFISVGLISIIGPSSYETIDDFFMQSIASGFFGGSPDEHLIYTNFLIGFLLKFLFSVFSNINWYGAYLLTSHVIAWAILFYVFNKYLKLKYAIIAYTYLFLVFGIYFIHNLQFTTSTALLSVSALLLLYQQIDQSKADFKRLILPALLLVFAALMRMHSAVLSIVLISPIFLTLLPNKKKFFKSVLIVGVLFVACNLPNKLDAWYYHQDKSWGEYYDNFYGSAVFNDDNAFYIAHHMNPEKPYRDFGWTDNDLAIFTSFFRDYPPIFNQQNYDNLKIAMKEVPFDGNAFKSNLLGKLRNIHLLFCLLLVLFFSSRLRQLSIFLSLLLIVASIAYVVTRFQLKERALYSMLFAFCSLSIWSFLSSLNNKEISWRIPIIKKYESALGLISIILLGALALNTFRNEWKNHKDYSLKNKLILENQLSLLEKNQNSTYAIFGASLKLEASGPFATQFIGKTRYDIYPISAFNKSPFFFDKLKTLGNGSLSDALLNPKVKFLTNAKDDYGSGPSYMQTFYKEHFDCSPSIIEDTLYEHMNTRIYALGECKQIIEP